MQYLGITNFLGIAGLILALLLWVKLTLFEWRMKTMADTFTADVARLEADVTKYTDLVTGVQANTKSNTDTIAALKAQIAALPPAVDTTQMEAALKMLEDNNTALAGTVPAPTITL